jgi:hypothetical protein
MIDGVRAVHSVNAANEDGWTALLIATDKGHTDVAALLLDRGAGYAVVLITSPISPLCAFMSSTLSPSVCLCVFLCVFDFVRLVHVSLLKVPLLCLTSVFFSSSLSSFNFSRFFLIFYAAFFLSLSPLPLSLSVCLFVPRPRPRFFPFSSCRTLTHALTHTHTHRIQT